MIDIEKTAHELALLEVRNVPIAKNSASTSQNNSYFTTMAKRYFDAYTAIESELKKLVANED